MALADSDMMAAIAVTRFGLGARPGELDRARSDAVGWLNGQITEGPASQPPGDLPDSAARLTAYREVRQQRLQAQRGSDETPQSRLQQRQAQMLAEESGQSMEQVQAILNLGQASGLQEEVIARAQLAASTDAPFQERWVNFWSNHFTVSAVKGQSLPVAGPFEREAIRPAAFGHFGNMLLLSSTHPGMMLYLDQSQSVGPNSQAAMRRALARRRAQGAEPGLNENLAREILELHTVGVHAGYTQDDVTELARAMTGWSVGGPNDGDRTGKFVFRAATHEPGSRTVMGKTYRNGGADQALEILRDLAMHPATARHVAGKLATHFVADDPPESLIGRLETAFKDAEGDLAYLARALITADEAWTEAPQKFKTPYELLISAHRALGVSPRLPRQIVQPLNDLGQPPFRAPSPKGWPEDEMSWAAPDALIKRLAWSESFAEQVSRGPREPLKVAQDALGARLSSQSASAIISAESRSEALTLLFMSPEFQRR